MKIQCYLNLAALPALLKKIGSAAFVAIPDFHEGKKLALDERKLNFFIGSPECLHCDTNGLLEVLEMPGKPETGLIASGIPVAQIAHFFADMGQHYSRVQMENMVIWQMR